MSASIGKDRMPHRVRFRKSMQQKQWRAITFVTNENGRLACFDGCGFEIIEHCSFNDTGGYGFRCREPLRSVAKQENDGAATSYSPEVDFNQNQVWLSGGRGIFRVRARSIRKLPVKRLSIFDAATKKVRPGRDCDVLR